MTGSEHAIADTSSPLPLPASGSDVVSVPLDLRVRLWLMLVRLLQALRIYPTMRRMPHLPLEKRKASKPPRWLTRPLPPDVAIEDHPAVRRGLPLSVRTYRHPGADEPLPIVMFTHGGGFVNGGLESMQFLCAHLAYTAGVLIVSADYPLAPESPYPEALDSCYETLGWLAELGDRLGGDPSRLCVMGDSAGGNIAAALTLRARAWCGPRILRQILIYPTLDATLSTPRMQSERHRRRRECETFYSHYAGTATRSDELISPLLAPDLTHLPPATIITAEHDSLSDDGRLYATRLTQAGVPVRYTHYPGVPHGFLSMPRLCRAAPHALAEIANDLHLTLAN
jgi:acetyl esterase